jgi:hypothetical protein
MKLTAWADKTRSNQAQRMRGPLPASKIRINIREEKSDSFSVSTMFAVSRRGEKKHLKICQQNQEAAGMQRNHYKNLPGMGM